jgi:GAF domain-containing protein
VPGTKGNGVTSVAPQRDTTPPNPSFDRALASVETITAAALTTDLPELLTVICQEACATLGVARSSVYLRRTDGRFQGQAGHSVSEDITPRLRRHVAGPDTDALTAQVLERRGPAAGGVRDVSMTGVRDAMRRWGSVDILAVPLSVGDEVIGILYLDDHGAPRTYSHDDNQVATLFARVCGPAVRQTWSASRDRPARASLEHLYQSQLTADRTVAEVAQGVADGRALPDLLDNLATGLGVSAVVYSDRLHAVAHAVPAPPIRVPHPVLPVGVTTSRAVQRHLARLGQQASVMIPASPRPAARLPRAV